MAADGSVEPCVSRGFLGCPWDCDYGRLIERAGAMLKRKDSAIVRGEGDKLEVTPLGAGNEVGRSCVYMTYKGKTVMVRTQPFLR